MRALVEMKEIMQEWRLFLNEQVQDKKKIYVLVGPPAAFDRMIGGYESPSEDEGFIDVQNVKAWWAK